MNFCPVCDYLLFIETYYDEKIEKKTTSGENIRVRNICKNCGHKDDIDNENDDEKLIMISNTTNAIDNVDVSSFMNKYTIHDKTTPHVDNIPCQNLECVTLQDGSTVTNDVMFVRYDHINLKYLYQCVHCHHTWKN